MMRDQIQQAFQRAARNAGPLWQPVTVYVQPVDDEFGRPIPNTFDWTGNSYACVWWGDSDAYSKTAGGEVGEGRATLAGLGGTPDLILTAQGEFLEVTDELGRDALGVGLTVKVRRWKRDAPTIRNAAP